MRVKTFTAETTAAAMDMVRDTLGNDAIIVSTRTATDGSTSVTAAVEPATPANEDFEQHEPLVFPDETEGTIRQALTYHGVPPWLANRLAKKAAASGADTAALALAAALDDQFSFLPLAAQWPEGPLLLVGPPGAGKTITAAKLCARERLERRPVAVISTDTKRAGGIEQLAAFTRILDLDLITAPGPADLLDAVEGIDTASTRIVIDTPGLNPFDEEQAAVLIEIAKAARGSVVLVLAAGNDPMEAADLARAYGDLGANRMIVTRLDLARRYGGLLAAAEGAGLGLAEVSISAQVAEGLIPVSPVAMAKLILPHAEDRTDPPESTEATE
ncbi:MAG: hypothetical protein OXR84_07335 [Magnetovibrio sp.]|nr:hypothetical protein [Magnetovibrio sp.]